MARNVQLLVIDPQNDFCDLPVAWQPTDVLTGQRTSSPALPVAGAHADMQRLAQFIGSQGDQLDTITVTLDSHQRFDIAHPGFWQTGTGAEVAPFTPITAVQVRAGDFTPRNPATLPRTLQYLDALETQGRYTLMVWPVHCEVGSWGHGIHADVLAAFGVWQLRRQRAVRNVFKGTNPWTEHYSAIEAEVPDADDESTALNTALLQSLGQADVLLIAGEASSHCVRSTTEHIVQHLPRLLPGWQASRIVLLTDGMSPVGGFEAQHRAFLDAMRTAGAQLANMNEIRL
ncbi:cysteine hydrolase [Acidovorax sp. ACV01]|uniref:cysteine hydrolase n=1 Tax=Acidovorax sp. ACV01 TaxID=2769311 RepID=UPI001780EFA2|nr:cysteine hydrolase [Acidovorax sp. ACV01]MBD9393490.1 cysteine hydrolase [Acidovorax sp. ACV01]